MKKEKRSNSDHPVRRIGPRTGLAEQRAVPRAVFTVFVLLFTLLHLVEMLTGIPGLQKAMVLFGAFTLFFALLSMQGRSFLLPLTIASIAFLIVFLNEGVAGFLKIWEGVLVMREMVMLLLTIPLVGWVLRLEPYVRDLMVAGRRFLRNSRRFYAGIMVIIQVVANFMLVGSVPVMHQFLQSFLKGQGEVWNGFKVTAVLRGFALNCLWVFSFPSLAFAIQILDVPLLPVVLRGLLLSVLGMGLAAFFYSRYERRQKVSLDAELQEEINRSIHEIAAVHEEDKMHRRVVEFGLLFVSLIGSAALLHTLFNISILTLLPNIVIIWTVLYFLLKRKGSLFLREGRHYITSELPRKSQEFSVVLAAGLLIMSLNMTGMGAAVVQSIYQWTVHWPWFNFLWLLPLVVLFLGVSGLSPMTSMLVLGGILQSIHLPYPNEAVVLSMTIGTTLCFLLSPVLLPALFLSAGSGETPVKVTMGRNWGFALAFFLLSLVYLQVVLWIMQTSS